MKFFKYIFLFFIALIFSNSCYCEFTKEEKRILRELREQEGNYTSNRARGYLLSIKDLEKSEKKNAPRLRMITAMLYGTEKRMCEQKIAFGWGEDKIVETLNYFQDIEKAKAIMAELENEFKDNPEVLYYLFNLYSKQYPFWDGVYYHYYGTFFSYIKEKADEYKKLVPEETNFDEIALSLFEDVYPELTEILGESPELQRKLLTKRAIIRYSKKPETSPKITRNFWELHVITLNEAACYGAEKFVIRHRTEKACPIDMDIEIENPIYDLDSAKSIIAIIEEGLKDEKYALPYVFGMFFHKNPYPSGPHTFYHGEIIDYIKERAALYCDPEDIIYDYTD